MDFFQTLFFESRLYLTGLSFLLFGASLFVRRGRRETIGRWIVPATMGLIVLLFVLQAALVTQRERIWLETDRFITAVEARDFAAIREIISPVYDSEGMDAEGILRFIELSLQRLHVYDTRAHRRSVRVTGARAEMILAARATVRADGAAGQMHWGSWRIDWRREADQWRIIALRPTMIDGVEFDGLRALAPHIP